MNTIVPSLPKPPPVEASQTASDNDTAAAGPAPNQGFAAAMQSASAKPVRKSPAKNTGGDKLPDGNPTPPATQALPPAAGTAAAAQAAGSASGATSTPTTASTVKSTAVTSTAAASTAAQPPSTLLQTGAQPAKDSRDAAAGGPSFGDDGSADTADPVAPVASAPEAAAAPTVPPSSTSGRAALDTPVATTLKTPTAPSPRLAAGTTGARAVGASSAASAGVNDSAADADGVNGSSSNAAPSAGSSASEPMADSAAASQTTPPYSAQPNTPVMPAAQNGIQANTPDAATTLAAAGASASAAVAASASRVITALATSTAVDEKHVRSVATTTDATATPGIDGGASAAQAASATSTPQPIDASTATFKVSANVDSSDFSQGVANQISTMVDKNITSAKLQVNPPSLGPIEVRIAVQGGHAQVWMVSHSAVTRDALQSSSPTLREMLGNQGFGQVSVDISQRSFQERTPTPQTYTWNQDTERSDSTAAVSALGSTARASSGGLDAYA